MATINIAHFEDSLVLHFSTQGQRLNAYTLASTLVAIADAAKAANAAINPGCEVEVVVEALGPGSFRAKIRTIYKKKKGLLATQVVVPLVIGIVGSYIYDRTLKADDSVKVEISTNEVVITRGNDRVIVPRNMYDALKTAEKNPDFPRAMTRVFEAVARDEDVHGLGIVPQLDSPPPDVIIDRADLQKAALLPIEMPNIRIVPEIVDLQIIKAILERSRRKWEFMWRGVKISAPVTDEKFYIDFFCTSNNNRAWRYFACHPACSPDKRSCYWHIQKYTI